MKNAVKNLFDFETIHLVSRGYFIFTNARLKRDFGKFKTGTVVPEIHIDGINLYICQNPDDHMHHSGPEFNFHLIFSSECEAGF